MSKYHILLVEDNTDLRGDFAELFSLSGYEVTTAADGVEAWSELSQNKITIIVSDYDMPNMNGYELFQKIRAHDHLQTLPFIMVSGAHNPKFEGDDYFSFLRKPIQIERLLDKIAAMIAT